jgi:iron(III) transport system permease protein
LDGWNRGLPFVSQWEAIIDSLWAASIGALLTISLVIAPAWLSKNRPIYKYATFLSSALPGVLLAFGLMALTLQITSQTGGYGVVLSSGALLFLGYAMRFMSEAFGPISAATLQLNPKLAESAKSLNRYPGLWIRKVVIPHIKPSIATAYLIVFLACIKELPITLLLGGSTGLRTLAFRTWDRYNEALLHDAGLSGLSLIGIALIMTIITLRWRRHA